MGEPSTSDLRAMAVIEGRSLRGWRLGVALGVEPAVARRRLVDLYERGVARLVTALRPGAGVGEHESVAYLRTDWTDPRLQQALEQELLDDRHVWSVAQITGPDDYVIRAFHQDVYQANDWFRALLDHPCVVMGRLETRCTLLERPSYAAALLSAGQKQAGPTDVSRSPTTPAKVGSGRTASDP